METHIDSLNHSSLSCVTHFFHWLTDSLSDWLIDRPTDCLAGWPTHSLYSSHGQIDRTGISCASERVHRNKLAFVYIVTICIIIINIIIIIISIDGAAPGVSIVWLCLPLLFVFCCILIFIALLYLFIGYVTRAVCDIYWHWQLIMGHVIEIWHVLWPEWT